MQKTKKKLISNVNIPKYKILSKEIIKKNHNKIDRDIVSQ